MPLISIASQYTQISFFWTDWKKIYMNKGGTYQYIDDGITTTVWFYDTPEVYIVVMWNNGNVPIATINAGYSVAQNNADLLDFQTNWQANANKRINPLSVDGRPINAINAFPAWVTLYFTSRGDNSINGIGKGSLFQSSSDGYGSYAYSWSFNDCIFILGATILYTGAQLGDTVDYMISAPATVKGTGTTQVNLLNVGPGNIIMPASGTGQTTINLTTAIPVPNTSNTGFWDWSFPQTGNGVITANPTQTGKYDLFDFSVNLSHLAIQIPLIGDNRSFELLVESVISMQLCPQWTHTATIFNSGHTGLRVGWVLAAARAVVA